MSKPRLSMNAIIAAKESGTLEDHILPSNNVVNHGPVTTSAQVLKGLERIGLKGILSKTGSPAWKRIYIYDWNYGREAQIKNTGNDKNYMGLYVGRVSLEYDEVKSVKLHISPMDYHACAINEMMRSRTILSHINFYAIGVKAYNETFHHLDGAKELLAKRRPGCKKAMEKARHKFISRFDQLLRGRYVHTSR